jgi:hypothetical protein
MIEADKRKAIFLLHQEGMGVRPIARQMRVSGGHAAERALGQATR